MLTPDADASSGSPLEYQPVAGVSWEAYTVQSDGVDLGFVSRLPEGTWIAYRADGKRPGTFLSRAEAATTLADDHLVAPVIDAGRSNRPPQ